jgi:thiosulfate/3-mercaptopyruvate sulfurtransferase
MSEENYTNSHLLIETHELESKLETGNQRIIDCNVEMGYPKEGGYDIKSGYEFYRESHVPGALFLDLTVDLSDHKSNLNFMLPSAAQFSSVVGKAGVSNNHDIVLYSKGANYWATRLFLMFRAYGCNNVRVLNGGWDKWCNENRPTTQEITLYPEEVFNSFLQPYQIIGKKEVQKSMNGENTCIINALSPDIFSGKKFQPHYGRPGHITGSVNLYSSELINKNDMTFINPELMREKFHSVSALKKNKVIAYCGGGISATTTIFGLLLLGKKNVALYDGSLTEWGNDPDLPMETLKNI